MARKSLFLYWMLMAMFGRPILADEQARQSLVKPVERAVAGTVPTRTPAREGNADRLLELVHGAASVTVSTFGKAPEVDLVRIRLLRMQVLRWQKVGMQGDVDAPARPQDARRAGDAAEHEPLSDEDDSFDGWAFGGKEGRQKFRLQLDRLLDRKLAEVKQFFELTAPQERKLRLAGKGDVQRLLDLVDRSHREFDRGRTDPARLEELRKDLRLIELRVSEGPFEMGSLFTKTLRKLYDDKQLTRKRPASMQ